MIRDHLFIVFCAHGSNALGIIHSLHEAGVKPVLIVNRDGPHNYADKSKYIGKKYYVGNSRDALELLIRQFGHEEKKPFVYTTDDFHAQLLDENYDRLSGRFYFFNCGETGRLTALLNKDLQCKMAEECGFLVPAREVVYKGVLPTTLHYPIITKTISSNEGGWKNDVHVCHNETDLINAYEVIEANTLLLEEYIDREEEVAFQGISFNQGESVIVPVYSKCRSFSEKGLGYYLCYSQSCYGPTVSKISQLVRRMRFEGVFELELMIDKKGDAFFLEVNLRTSAKNYAVTFGGFNLPFQWANAISSGKTESFQPKGLFWAMDEFSDYVSRVRTKRVGVMKWLSEVRGTSVFFWHYGNDIGPVLDYYLQKLKSIFRK